MKEVTSFGVKTQETVQSVTEQSAVSFDREVSLDSEAEQESTTGVKLNRTYKDSLFCKIFSGKDELFELYQALHPEDLTATPDDLKIITLDNALVNSLYNDLGFTVGDRLIVLVEEQSSVCRNMPMRFLLYLAHEYEEYIKARDIAIHARSLKMFPRPEFYVVDTTGACEKNLFLSSAFGKSDDFDKSTDFLQLRVQVISMEQADTMLCIQEYIEFVQVVKREYDKTHDVHESVKIALNAIEGTSLVGKKIKEEVLNMTAFEEIFSLENIMRDREEEAAELAAKEAEEKTRREEEEKARIRIEQEEEIFIDSFLEEGFSDEKIKEIMLKKGKSLETIEAAFTRLANKGVK